MREKGEQRKARKSSVLPDIRAFFGAGDRGRTDTVSLPQDFESSASANSTTPAYNKIIKYPRRKIKRFFGYSCKKKQTMLQYCCEECQYGKISFN